MKLKHFFGLLFFGSLLFFGYCLWVFGALAQVDQLFEINTRFKDNDLQNWLAPQRKENLISRFGENRSSQTEPRAIKTSVLNECILAEKPCVDMLAAIAPARFFWKTAPDIYLEKEQVQKELFKALKAGKIKDRFDKPIKCKTQLMASLQEEQALLKNSLDSLPAHYAYFGGLYNLWNYSPVSFFTFLHYSRFISELPGWLKNHLNSLASWYMAKKYPEMKQETKKIIKKKTSWFFHWVVESRVEKAFEEIKNKAEKHSYIHDYSPYYHKLQNDFDLEAKNVYNELLRLLERNKALQEII
ncbi:MAG: hypothetical protein K2X90_01635 [Candidatus Babeliaceae bacterium]|nr:hypothetical protein [Candidatus Babeliaceae bacterium]